MQNSMQNKYVVVTGGGSGIGKGVAARFVELGAHVTIIGRSQDRLEDAVADLKKLALLTDQEVKYACCDVTSEQEIADTLSEANFPEGLDVLVANAGVALPSPILEANVDTFRLCYDINVVGAALCFKYAARLMMQKGGAIVAVSSIAGRHAQKYMAPYSASKAALKMLVEGAACELGEFNIRVNSIEPGLIKTEIVDDHFTPELTDDFASGALLEKTIGEAKDIANAAVFLSSEQSSWVTGHTMVVDGGVCASRGFNWESLAGALLGPDAIKHKPAA